MKHHGICFVLAITTSILAGCAAEGDTNEETFEQDGEAVASYHWLNNIADNKCLAFYDNIAKLEPCSSSATAQMFNMVKVGKTKYMQLKTRSANKCVALFEVKGSGRPTGPFSAMALAQGDCDASKKTRHWFWDGKKIRNRTTNACIDRNHVKGCSDSSTNQQFIALPSTVWDT